MILHTLHFDDYILWSLPHETGRVAAVQGVFELTKKWKEGRTPPAGQKCDSRTYGSTCFLYG